MTQHQALADAAERELRKACAQLDSELRSGAMQRVESLLPNYPALAADDDQLVELILNEFAIRESIDPTVRPEEYYVRFPQFRERLERLFEVDRLLRDSIIAPLADGDHSTLVDGKAPPADKPRRRRQIGSYEIVETLGSGGMGVVYKATQLGLNRTAAVKILRGEANTDDSTRARFLREAELAAQLQHPNIVQVFEIGETDGQPFLAMEYVAGRNLHQYLDGRPLAFDPAARLLLAMARAMQYAHDRGVIHRDLKPANVLLDEASKSLPGRSGNDGGPPSTNDARMADANAPPLVPKIADFGLAIRVDEQRMLTAHGQVLGTVTYMAPEQATGQSTTASPAADVYSLGAIAYELLTGRPPFLADGYRETIRKLLHEEAVPPRRLRPTCPRDLETICLKCLEKDPAKRYPNAGPLADDLDRYLASQPIMARPSSALDRMGKWVRRRPWGAAFAGLCLVASIAFMGTIAAYTVQLDRVARRAKEGWANADAASVKFSIARDAEAAQAIRTRKALDMVTDHIVEDWLARNPGLSVKHYRFLEGMLEQYTTLAAQRPDDAAIFASLAQGNRRVGGIQLLLGDFAAAERSFSVATANFDRLRRQRPEDVELQTGWYWSTSMLCAALQQVDRVDQAAKIAEAALTELEKLRPLFGKERWLRIGLAQMAMFPAIARYASHRFEDAEEYLRECQRRWNDLARDFPDEPQHRHGRLWALQIRAAGAYNARRPAESEKHSREILRLGAEFSTLEPSNFEYPFRTGAAMVNLGRVEAERGLQGDEVGIARIERGLRFMEHYVRTFPNRSSDRLDYGLALSSLAFLHADKRNAAAAVVVGKKAVEQMELAIQRMPHSVRPMVALGGAGCNLGNGQRMNGHQKAALAAYDRALLVLSEAARRAPDNVTVKTYIGNTHMGRGKSLEALERYREAADAYAESLKCPISDRLRTYLEAERIKVLARVH